jgi:sugar-specific transcriptional regulator TrmB
MDIDRALVEFGLHETEARFYLAALELGQAPMREVASKAGVSRTNAYDVFTRLLEQRLVSQVQDASSRSMLIVAEAPERVLEIIEERRRKLEIVLPELRSLHNRSASKPKVRFYQGSDGIKAVLNETLTCRNKQLLGILSMRDLYEVPGREWMDDLIRRRVAAGVSLRVVRSHGNDIHQLWSESARELRTLRYAPPDFVFTMTMYIFDKKVAVISSRQENFAMTIESEELARMQTNLFEILWSVGLPGTAAQERHDGSVPGPPGDRVIAARRPDDCASNRLRES